MQDPQDPLRQQYPMDDPFLDPLERSIENPPGFHDPMAQPDELFMDDQARMLGALEASIVDVSPNNLPRDSSIPSAHDIGSEIAATDPTTPELGEQEQSLPLDNTTPSETINDAYGSFDTSPPLPREGSSHTPPPNPPKPRMLRRGTGGGRGRKSISIPQRNPSRFGRATAGLSVRYCRESLEIIDKQQCEDCEKFRNWPDGTDNEPRECWYEWLIAESLRQMDTEDEDDNTK